MRGLAEPPATSTVRGCAGHPHSLLVAVRHNNMVAMVQALVDGGADIRVQDNGLHNTLHLCESIELLRFFHSGKTPVDVAMH
ncbi:hypothetical protein K438DRAFT_552225 [Mycena galopus ATCC 62051]|nr:hypothetical protein K438DRAFT_552225 [Mycena galopus ATCC 62051]